MTGNEYDVPEFQAQALDEWRPAAEYADGYAIPVTEESVGQLLDAI